MRILLTGATGFIGSHLARTLTLAGHSVLCAVRAPPQPARYEYVTLDIARMTNAAAWLPYLRDIDAVINAVGIFEQRGAATFAILHTEMPRALFAACATARVKRIVQISALGAALDADTEFLRSKARADEALLQQKTALVLQPSLVFGAGGASSELFVKLAALPALVLPDGGTQRIQPVHIDDICTAVLRYVEAAPIFAYGRIAAVGPRALRMRDYLQTLRAALGHSAPLIISVSSGLLAGLARWLPLPWLQPDALRMLQRGSCADAAAFAALMQRTPRAPETFAADVVAIEGEWRVRLGINALRLSLALLWIVTGIISLWVYPIASSLELLARSGVPAPLQLPALYGAALLDIAFGIAIVFMHSRRRWLWRAQAMLIVFYSAVIAWKLPEFWLHPYAPMVKNIPLLAAIYLLSKR